MYQKCVSETLRKLIAMSCGACECYMLKYSVLIPNKVCWCEHSHVEFGGEGNKECFLLL